MTTTFATAILKNVEAENATSGVAIASVIMAEANRREHLAGHVSSVQWDRQRGIGVLVDDAGHRQHLANALDLPKETYRISMGALGWGIARKGTFGGYQVTIWNVEV